MAKAAKKSAKQGDVAKTESRRYALCVISRPHGHIVDKDCFIDNAQFVTNIGELLSDKVTGMTDNLLNIRKLKVGDTFGALDNEGYGLCVKKSTWSGNGIKNFKEFIEHLKKPFSAQ